MMNVLTILVIVLLVAAHMYIFHATILTLVLMIVAYWDPVFIIDTHVAIVMLVLLILVIVILEIV
jgi:hypothetical protein